MPRWKIVVEYEGTEFSGWQRQPDARTVQEELDRALSTVLREEIRVTGAGRTDAGVHALGQVASFESTGDPAGALVSLNAVLPDDVIIRAAQRAPEGFHARHHAIRRHYRYRLHRGPVAVERKTCLALRGEVDLAGMRAAAALLPGDRDFASFASAIEPGETTRVRLEEVDVVEIGGFVNVEVTANRFLRKMVRTLVGTLLEVGWGRRPPGWIAEVVAARDRKTAGPVVSPRGLFLVAVDYPEGP